MVVAFGATGKVGTHFVNQAVHAGYKVRAFVRNRAKFAQSENPNIEVFEGDATNADDVERAVTGADVIVSCLGNPNNKTTLIMYTAHNNILNAAAKQARPPKCVMISSIGCGGSSWIIKQMLMLIGGKAGFDDYERADKRVRQEVNIPFVLVRPYALTDEPGIGGYKIIPGRTATFAKSISRSDVALFFLHCLEDKQWDYSAVMLGGQKK